MCLSEPQAGSSLAGVRTRAVADGDDMLWRAGVVPRKRACLFFFDNELPKIIAWRASADAFSDVPAGTSGANF